MYQLKDILNFSRKIERECKSGVPSKFLESTLEESLDFIAKRYKLLEKNPSRYNLQYYAQAINVAGQFIQKNKETLTQENLVILSKHIDDLCFFAQDILKQRFTLPEKSEELSQPQPRTHQPKYNDEFLSAVKKLDPAQGTKTDRTQTTKKFLESETFQKLKTYQTMLAEDKRDHTFWGYDFSVRGKHEALAQIITSLESQETMDGIRTVLKVFYDTKKSKRSDPELKSIYAYLNTGQNITTRVLGIKTTTIKLIDSLNELAKKTVEQERVDTQELGY